MLANGLCMGTDRPRAARPGFVLDLQGGSVHECFGHVQLPLPRAAPEAVLRCAAAPRVSGVGAPGTSHLLICCAVVNANVALFTLT